MQMLRLLLLLLPALIPSWEFFKTIEPSPRVQWRDEMADAGDDANWQDFKARPQRLSFGHMLLRLFWNPDWNEVLYSVSLAERLTIHPTDHSHQELCRLIKGRVDGAVRTVQFRLVFVQRKGTQVDEVITYLSDPFDVVPP